eukprot:jgi/Orpsp1_1/1187996/evm.model.d7180000061757.1
MNIIDTNGNTPITLAYQRGYHRIFQFLIKCLDINKSDSNGNTVLYYSIMKEDIYTIKTLIDLGADINHKNKIGNSLLDIALIKGNKEIILFLLQQNINIKLNKPNEKGETLLITLIKTNIYTVEDKIKIINHMIEKGVNVNKLDSIGNSALMYAIQKKSMPLIELLINNGANVHHIIKNSNQSLLMLAIELGEFEITKYLIECNANVNFRNSNNDTPWKMALKRHNKKIIKYLAKYYIKNLTGDDVSFLISNSTNEKLELLKILVENGLDIDLKTSNGDTLLAIAIMNRQNHIINYLVDSGANLYSINKEGKSILNICSMYLVNSSSLSHIYNKIKNLHG